jgi:diketogulonate reductase-like aldo/keto reductase
MLTMNTLQPTIIYGTAWKKSDTEELVKSALHEGFRAIDTACQPKHYDEAGVGAGIAASLNATLRRADLYLQTKFTALTGQDPKLVPYDPRIPLAGQVTQSLGASLRNLRTAYVDCLLLHSPLDNAQQTLVAWRAMESLVAGGAVRQLGISNCYHVEQLDLIYKAVTVKPSVVQNRFYAAARYDREIRAFCTDHQMTYQSFWTLTANRDLLARPAVIALAAKHHRTPEQVWFRYVTQLGIVPLTGTRSRAHMREDLDIFGFELDAADRETLDAFLLPA